MHDKPHGGTIQLAPPEQLSKREQIVVLTPAKIELRFRDVWDSASCPTSTDCRYWLCIAISVLLALITADFSNAPLFKTIFSGWCVFSFFMAANAVYCWYTGKGKIYETPRDAVEKLLDEYRQGKENDESST